MKLGVLFSGGKDSCFACFKAMKGHEIKCLITLHSENKESYMFHTPNIEHVELQAMAMGIPIIIERTKGIKEEELLDLKKALMLAKNKYAIEGIVTGAIASNYQKTRVEKTAKSIGLECINPIWEIDEMQYLKELIASGFRAVIVGIAAYPLTEKFLGRIIDEKFRLEIKELYDKYNIHPAGEGGEYETFVIFGPIFKKRIEIIEAIKEYKDYAGILKIKKLKLV
jgi:ABC transporter with metal-binding/Fe-S-binding domain ATP-binding protein